MRDDGDFLFDLRKELAAAQYRRHTLVMAKLALVTGLLAFGFAGIGKGIAGEQLLLLVPLVAFVFDLYIVGEDFAVKRVAKFLMLSDGTPPLEAAWEKGVARLRDRTGDFASLVSSGLAIAAAAIGFILAASFVEAAVLAVLGAVSLALLAENRRRQDRMLRSFRPVAKASKPRRKKRKAARRGSDGGPAELNGELPEPEHQPLLPL